MSDVIVQYTGFTPTEYMREYIEKLLREVREESPSTSIVNASICLADRCFKGTIRINSCIGGFFAIATDVRLKLVGKKMAEQIRKQLNRWKETRFVSDGKARDLIEREQTEEDGAASPQNGGSGYERVNW